MTNLAFTQAKIQDFELAHRKIYPIYVLQEYIRGGSLRFKAVGSPQHRATTDI